MRLLILAAAALAIAGCHKAESPTINEAVPNVSTVDANAMPEDANVTDVPADDGDAPTDENAAPAHRSSKTVKTTTTAKTETK
ncbi:hypothetical protein [Sphingomonas sp.]|uniref:hypothetical protein n=1 Tax=Sphingomonas sp. TaxID=28214 RepID=UPI0025D5E856|nr:hypothetical protein [Sphingomonas sp.]